jgi:4-amino-4-deoxy-L-arabinose transferase-like glycosyltransferase
MGRKTWAFLLALFVAAFAVRVAVVLALRDIHAGPSGIASADDVEFHHLALRVSRGEGYVNDQGLPTSFRAPGWPLFLAGLYWLGGPHVPLVYVVLCLLGAVACVLTYLLARELVAEGTARAAGVLAALYLPHVYFSAGFLSEALFVVCLTLGVWLFLVSLRRDSLTLLMLAGLALGWATLTRPFALLLWPIMLPLSAIRYPLSTPITRGSRMADGGWRMALFTLAFFACIAPWTLRNQQVHGRFVLIATNGGSTFYGGNNERVAHELRQLGSWISTTELPHRDWIDAAPTELAHDQREWKLGLDWLREHPRSLPQLYACKAARLCLWLPDFDGGSRWFFALRILGYAPFLMLMLVGLWTCLRQREHRRGAWLVVHGTMLATLATALVFWGSPRFRDANLSFLMIYAAVGWARLWRQQNVNDRERGLLISQGDTCAPPAPPRTSWPAHMRS